MSSQNIVFARAGLLGTWLLVLLSVPLPARAQNTPPQVPAPTGTPKKIWTNENIASIHGNIPSADSGASQTSSSGDKFESTSTGASFVNPKPGQLVYPGETLQVDIAIDSGITLLRGAAIMMSPGGGFSEIRNAPPYSFTLKVPENEVADHNLIGLQTLTAMGPVAGRLDDPDLAMTTIDVEEQDLPLSLFAAGGMMGNRGMALSFFEAGQDQRIAIYARFPNGHEVDVSRSEYLQLASSDANVIRVADRGTVVSVGAGNASVVATYTLKGQQKQLFIPVSVQLANQTLVASPATVDFGDIAVGSTSPSRQVTITNNSLQTRKIYSVSYSMGPENCSNTVLAPGGSCTLTVSLSVNSPGPVRWKILVDTLPVTLLGNGI